MTLANSTNTEAKVAKYNTSLFYGSLHRLALGVDLVQVNAGRIEDGASEHDCR
jgi:hypothetical protein